MRSTHVLSFAFLVLAGVANAGDVTVTVNGGKLRVQGSSGDDFITIDQAGLTNPKQFRVSPGAATTVNGNASAQVFPGVSGDFVIDLAAGMNTLRLTELRARGDVVLDAGAAGKLNANLLDVTVDHDVRASSAGGDLTIGAMTARIDGDLRVHGGAGIDQVDFSSYVLVKGDLEIDLGPGADGVELLGSRIRGHASIRTGTGTDALGFAHSTFERDLRLSNGGDKDEFQFGLVTVADDLSIKGGAGIDQFSCEVLAVRGKTTVDFGNGGSNAVLVASTFQRDVVIRAGAGEDSIIVGQSTTIGGDLDVKLGDDPNFLRIENSSLAGRFDYKGGDDDDDVVVSVASIEKDVRIALGGTSGPATNSASIMILTAGGDLSVSGGDGGEIVSLGQSIVQGAAKLRLHGGNNATSIFDTQCGQIDVHLGAGNDATTIDLDSSTRGDLRLNAGDGNNASTITGVVVGDDLVFRSGSGNDATTIDDTVVGGKIDVNTGGGADAGP